MRLRAIVIDDDMHCRDLLALILEQNGYEVVRLAEPTACPIYATPHACCVHEAACGDFLLTDNRMPVMSGLQFNESLQKRGCTGVVQNMAVLSAGWTDEELELAERLDCTILHKPYDIQALLDWLKTRGDLIPRNRKLIPLGTETGRRVDGSDG